MLVRPKDKDPKDCQSNVIYSCKFKEMDCNEEYLGETSRTLRERYREHLKEPFPKCVHTIWTGHNASEDKFNIPGKEDQGLTRLIKESIYIRVNIPAPNRNIGQFNLGHIWNRVLFNTPGLKLNNNNGQAQIQSNRPLQQPIAPIVETHSKM